METPLKTLGKVVRKYREKKGLTQEELGVFSDMSKSYVNRLEKGDLENPPIKEKIWKIAVALDVPPQELFFIVNQLPIPWEVQIADAMRSNKNLDLDVVIERLSK